jgi:hypothetical protein
MYPELFGRRPSRFNRSSWFLSDIWSSHAAHAFLRDRS